MINIIISYVCVFIQVSHDSLTILILLSYNVLFILDLDIAEIPMIFLNNMSVNYVMTLMTY